MFAAIIKMKQSWRQHVLALLLSALLFLVMVAVLLIQKDLENYEKDMVMVREIALASPPPPPPAPPVQQQMQEALPQLQLSVEGEGVAIAVSDVEMPETVEESLQLRAPEMRSTNIDWNLDLAVDWSAYGLDELDGMPSLLSSLRVEFPSSLTSRGIRSALVRLDVFIDESGRVSLISILENPYPELQSAIQRVVRNARFSVPQKGGQPVRARFIWPVEFTNS